MHSNNLRPHRNQTRLQRYIRKSLECGYSADRITSNLLKVGWKCNAIKKVFRIEKERIANKESAYKLFIASLIFIFALSTVGIFAYNYNLTGAFIVAGGDNWENRVIVIVSGELPVVKYDLVFDRYKPSNCTDGIYVEMANGAAMPFVTENEVYENNLCIETDVIWDNVASNKPAEANIPITAFVSAEFDETNETTYNITYYVYYGRIIEFPEEKITIPENITVGLPSSITDITPENVTLPINIANETAENVSIPMQVSGSEIIFDSAVYEYPPGVEFDAIVKIRNPLNKPVTLTLAPGFDTRLNLKDISEIPKARVSGDISAQTEKITKKTPNKNFEIKSLPEYQNLDDKLKLPEKKEINIFSGEELQFITPAWTETFEANEEKDFTIRLKMPDSPESGELWFYALGENLSMAVDPWWSSGWTYRQNITVKNNKAGILKNYTINMTINTASLISANKLQSDCDDIRFINSTNSLIDYWIESGCNSGSTLIWVEIPNLPASGTENITLYYGNSNAAKGSNGANTFMFFDDFDGASLNAGKWSADTPAKVSVANSIVTVTSTSEPPSPPPYADIFSIKSYGPGIEIVWNASASTDGGGNIYWGLADGGFPESNWTTVHTLQGYWQGKSGGSEQTTRNYAMTQFTRWQIQWNITSKYYANFSYEGQLSAQTPTASLKACMLSNEPTGTQTAKADWIFIRPLSPPEPTYTMGDEETLGSTFISVNGYDFVLESNRSISVTQNKQFGINNVLVKKTAENAYIGRLIADFPEEGVINISGFTGGISISDRKSVLYKSNWSSNITRKDLFIPGAGTAEVYVCPNAQNIQQVYDSCTGAFKLNLTTRSVKGATLFTKVLDGAFYIVVQNVTGTGGAETGNLINRTADSAFYYNGSEALDDVNASDNKYGLLTIDDSNTFNYVELNWTNGIQSLTTIDSVKFYFEHIESTTTNVQLLIQWLNSSSGNYLTLGQCSGKERLAEGSDSCDLTKNLSTPAIVNNITLRYYFNRTGALGATRTSKLDFNNLEIKFTKYEPNLILTKTDNPDPVNRGELLTYTLNYANTGNYNASSVVINESYPAQYTIFVSSIPAPDNSATNNSWTIGNLSNGTAGSINITVRVNASTPTSTILINTANASYVDGFGITKSVVVTAYTTVDTQNWPMFRHDQKHTGFNNISGPRTSNSLWNFTLAGYAGHYGSSPAVYEDRVYATDNANIYALNITTGGVIWQRNWGQRSYTSPAVYKDVLYIGTPFQISSDPDTFNNELFAYNATNGTFLYSTLLLAGSSNPIRSSPVIVNDVVYIGADTRIVAVNATGNITNEGIIWFNTTSGTIRSSPAVADDMVFVSDDTSMYAFNTTNGHKLFETTGISGGIYSSPAVVNGILYFGANDKRVYAYTNLTAPSLGGPYPFLPKMLWNFTTGGVVKSSPAVAYGLVFIGSNDSKLYAFNATTGVNKWNYTFNGGTSSSPAVSSNDMIYIGANNVLYAINTSGSLKWYYSYGYYNPENYTMSSPALASSTGSIGGKGKLAYIANFTLVVFDALPDFVVTDMKMSRQLGLVSGTNVSVNFTIKNIGAYKADAFNASLVVTLENNNRLVLNNSISPLAIGDSNSTFFHWMTTSGLHDVMAWPDYENKFIEESEDNAFTYGVGVDWPTFHQTSERTGFINISGPTDISATLWTYNVGSAVKSSPAIVNDIVYFGADDGNLYALSATTGDFLWSKLTTAGKFVRSSPTVYNGRIYIGSDDGKIYAFNTSGSYIWNYSTGGVIRSSPMVWEGTVYVSSNGGSLFALSAATGSVVWTYPLITNSSPAIVNGFVYVGGLVPQKLVVLDASTGQLAWTRNAGIIESTPAVVNTIVYYGSNDKKLYAVNVTTRALYWQQTLPDGIESSPVVYDDVVYIGCNDSAIYAFNATNGTQIWNYTTSNAMKSSPALAINNSMLYVGAGDFNLYAFNTTSHNMKSNYVTGATIDSSPAISKISYNGVAVVVGSDSGWVYAFGSVGGAPPNNVPTSDNPILNATDNPLNRTTANLTCYPQNLFDADGDAVWPIFNWYKNNQPYAMLNIPFNTNVSTTASNAVKDYSGYGNDGTLGGGTAADAPTWTSGKVGGAYSFDGINDYVALPSTLTNSMVDFTFEAWVYWTDPNSASWARIFDSGDGTIAADSGKWMDITPKGGSYMTFEITTSGWNNKQQLEGSVILPLNTWAHVALTLSGNTATLYLNGTSIGTGAITIDPKDLSAVNNYLGKNSRGDGDFFNGTIDEVRIYNRSLSASEIYQHYIEGSNKLNTSVITSSETSVGDVWMCSVTPNDGLDNGLTKYSLNLTIQATLPAVSSSNLTAAHNFTLDDLYCNASLSGGDGGYAWPIFNWYKNNIPYAVLNMPFGTNAGTAANAVKDYSGYNNHGTLGSGSSTPTWTSSGVFGGAYNFDGGNDYIDLGKPNSLNFTGYTDFTISAWVNIKGGAGTHRPILCRGDQQYCLKVYTGDTFEFCVYDTSWRCAYSDVAPAQNTWYYVIARTDGSEVSLWVNGTKQGTTTYSGISTSFTNFNVQIGADTASGRYFNGSIDEVYIYNRSLSAEQIRQNYFMGSNKYNTSVIDSDETDEGDVWTCQITPNDGLADGTAMNASIQIIPLNVVGTYSGTFTEAGNMTIALGGNLLFGSYSNLTIAGNVTIAGNYTAGISTQKFGTSAQGLRIQSTGNVSVIGTDAVHANMTRRDSDTGNWQLTVERGALTNFTYVDMSYVNATWNASATIAHSRISFAGSWTIYSGVIVKFINTIFQQITGAVFKIFGTLILQGSAVFGHLNVTSTGNLTMEVGGNATIQNNFYCANTTKLTNITTVIGNLTVDSGCTLTVANGATLRVKGLTTINNGGILGSNSAYNLDLIGTLTINSGGTLSAPSGTGNFTVNGTWIHNSGAIFTHNSGTVMFTSTIQGQTVLVGYAAPVFYNLVHSSSAHLYYSSCNITNSLNVTGNGVFRPLTVNPFYFGTVGGSGGSVNVIGSSNITDGTFYGVGNAQTIWTGNPPYAEESFLTSSFRRSDEELYLFTSTNGKQWNLLDTNSLYSGQTLRDPSIIWYKNKYYIAHTKDYGQSGNFSILSSTDLLNWELVREVVACSGGRYAWAPEFFIDTDGSVNIFVACGYIWWEGGAHALGTGEEFKIYNVNATNDNLTSWTAPVNVTGNFNLTTNLTIDACMVKIGSTYYLYYTSPVESYIEYATSTSKTSGFVVQETEDWAGWGADLEGESLVQINSTTWRIYLDKFRDGGEGIYYSESSDGFGTWTSKLLTISGGDFAHATTLNKYNNLESGGKVIRIKNFDIQSDWTTGGGETVSFDGNMTIDALTVSAGDTLNITTSGAVVTGNSAKKIVNGGNLNIIGASGNNIILTGYKGLYSAVGSVVNVQYANFTSNGLTAFSIGQEGESGSVNVIKIDNCRFTATAANGGGFEVGGYWSTISNVITVTNSTFSGYPGTNFWEKDVVVGSTNKLQLDNGVFSTVGIQGAGASSWIVSKNHNGVQNDWKIWGTVNSSHPSAGFNATSWDTNTNITLLNANAYDIAFNSVLTIDNTAIANKINVTANTNLNVTLGTFATSGLTYLESNGKIFINSGKWNNLTLNDGQNTKQNLDAKNIQTFYVNSAPAADAGSYPIGKYANISATSGNAFALLNISYLDADISGVSENSLRMAKHNSSWYTNPAVFASSYGISITNNYVYANITSFGSIFAPLSINTAPTHNNPILNATDNPLNRTTANLTCYPQNMSDVNGEVVWPIFNWYKNNMSYTVLNMPFNTNVSTTAAGAVKDYSGLNNNGTLGGGTAANAPTWTSNGTLGGAYDCDNSDFIDLPNDLGYSQSVSIVAWFKRGGSPPGSYHIISGGQELEISIPDPGGQIRTGVYTSDGRFVSNHGSGLLDGNWHLVGFTFNGSKKLSYIDGSYVGELDTAGTLTTSFSYRRLCRYGSSTTYYLNGSIDEVRIYNRTLSASEIYRLYLEGTNKLNISVITSDETTKNEIWMCQVTPNDGRSDGLTKNSTPLTVRNTPPNVPILNTPDNNSIIIDRTPNLNWSIPSDDDLDTLHWQVIVANDSAFANIVINANSTASTIGFYPTPPVAQNSGNATYNVQNNLDFIQYFWEARAWDGDEYGNWSGNFTFNVTSSVSCELGQANISFGTIIPGVPVNATLNYNGTGGGTYYNLTSSSNLPVNVTHKSTNMTSSEGNKIPVYNISWKSALTATDNTMNYGNKIAMQETYDAANKVATALNPYNTTYLRYWLDTQTSQPIGLYTGNYTMLCEAA